MKETRYFVALHLYLAIASPKEISQLVCNSHRVQAGFRLLWRSVSQSSRNIQRYSVYVLKKILDKLVSIRSQWQKAIAAVLGNYHRLRGFSNVQGTML